MTATLELTEIVTAGGHVARFACRPDTNDGALVHGIIGESEYPFYRLTDLAGWAIDVGAHIGIVSVVLALDNPDLRIVAVEPLPENVVVLRENVILNGLNDRIIVIEAAAGADGEAEVPITYGWSKAPNQPDHYMHDNRYIGGMVGPNESSKTILCPAINIAGIVDVIDQTMYGPYTDKGGPNETHPLHEPLSIALLKIDCEGCEWHFLRGIEMHRVQRVIGEMHVGRNGDAARLRELLFGFDVAMDDAQNVAIFEAVRR